MKSTNTSLTIAQQKDAAKVLGQAFFQDPFMNYLFPNSKTREQQITKLFFPVVKCSLLYGNIEITTDGKGILMWISGEYVPLKFSQVVRSGLIWTPFAIGLSACKRLQAHSTVCEHTLKEKAPNGFAYIWVVGVHPNYTGLGLGKQIIQSALEKMRNQGHSTCLVITENSKNVGFYEHLGFELIHTETPDVSEIPYWLMSRELV